MCVGEGELLVLERASCLYECCIQVRTEVHGAKDKKQRTKEKQKQERTKNVLFSFTRTIFLSDILQRMSEECLS